MPGGRGGPGWGSAPFVPLPSTHLCSGALGLCEGRESAGEGSPFWVLLAPKGGPSTPKPLSPQPRGETLPDKNNPASRLLCGRRSHERGSSSSSSRSQGLSTSPASPASQPSPLTSLRAADARGPPVWSRMMGMWPGLGWLLLPGEDGCRAAEPPLEVRAPLRVPAPEPQPPITAAFWG